MSWGERSCKHKPCVIPQECSFGNCNVSCRAYEWNGVTPPDSVRHDRPAAKPKSKLKSDKPKPWWMKKGAGK